MSNIDLTTALNLIGPLIQLFLQLYSQIQNSIAMTEEEKKIALDKLSKDLSAKVEAVKNVRFDAKAPEAK